MLWVPLKGRPLIQHNTGAVGTDTPGTSVTTGAAASTKGTPAQLFASTNFDTYWMTILASNYGTAATVSAGCLDILLGSATEEVIIANLLFGYAGAMAGELAGPKRWDFPLYIPAGSRIAAQAAGARVSTAFRVWMFLYGGWGLPPWRVAGKVMTYGITTVPDGTTIVPGASGAEGAWTEITASTSEDHFALVPSFQPTGDMTITTRALVLDLGIGAATEELIMESYWYGTVTTERMSGPANSFPCFKNVPSGTRLVSRVSNSGTNDAGYNGAIHALS